MEFSNRMPKERKLGKFKTKMTKKDRVKINYTDKQNFNFQYAEQLCHSKLRELQRYGTQTIDNRTIVNDICDGKAIIIKQEDTSVTALVRHINRYYIAVMDAEIRVIQTYLPFKAKFLDYVQAFINKENLLNLQMAS